MTSVSFFPPVFFCLVVPLYLSSEISLLFVFLGIGGSGCLVAWLDSCLTRFLTFLLQLACECYSRLPSLGAGFSQGLKHTESWEQELHSLLASLHSLLGALYEGAETGRVVGDVVGGNWEGDPERRGS